MDNDLSYEEEQLQVILINEMKKKQIQEERQLKENQDIEYLTSLREDETQDKTFEQISLQEMRRIRLKRFDKLVSINNS